MSIDNILTLITLQHSRLSPRNYLKYTDYFGSPEILLDQISRNSPQIEGVEKYKENIKNFDPQKILDTCGRKGIWVIGYGDQSFPESLMQIPDPPLVIYGRGQHIKEEDIRVAVVGSRKPTEYGRAVVKNFVNCWSGYGITIVSGLALGIDAEAHRQSLLGETKTIAVLGSSVDNPTPETNLALAEKILSMSGTILSEYPPATKVEPYHFPQRNRIIAGLSKAVVVVEGAKNSGSLITATIATSYHKDVYAVPGDIFSPISEGPNRLISIGANPLLDPETLVKDLGIIRGKAIDASNELEDTILAALNEPMTVDELCFAVYSSPEEIGPALIGLELRGAVLEKGLGIYQRAL